MTASTDNIVAIAGDVARSLITAWEEDGRLRKYQTSQAELQKLLLMFVAEACDTELCGYGDAAQGGRSLHAIGALERLSESLTKAADQIPARSFFLSVPVLSIADG